ncbi:MAG: hypothetical protein GKC10_05725 [Methanosarcinales archaeon]|nr:hypothetical protein [Methanosarcinales archaeon]
MKTIPVHPRTALAVAGLILILAAASLCPSSAQSSTKPMVSEVDSSDRDLQELEALFSGAKIDVSGEAEKILQPGSNAGFFGGDPMSALYSPPYADVFKNDSLYADFLGLFSEGITPPFMNVTQIDSYLNVTEKKTSSIRHVIS